MLTFTFNGAQGHMTEPEVLTCGMVGKKVRFVFSPEWDGLIKTAVYMAGDSCVIHPLVGLEDTIPAQVLAAPLARLLVGIYGQSPDGQLVIPTIRAEGPDILPGVEPQGDPETAPELPVWARILGLMGDMEQLRSPRQDTLVAAINSLIPTGEHIGHIFEGREGILFGDNMVNPDDKRTSGFHLALMRDLGLHSCLYSGYSGVTLAETATRIRLASGMESVVLVMAGIGDIQQSVPLGKMGDTSATTIYGSLHQLCQALLDKYPRAIHTVITPPFQSRYTHAEGVTSGDVAEAMVKVCGGFGIPVYDYYRFSGICRGNLDLLTNDYCHWNQNAQHMAGRNITRFMEQNFRFSWCELEAVPFPVGIRAEFNQDGAVICEKDSLQVLKDYLRVYACMNDASEEEVLDYSLSGTLEVGSSTVTVSWKGYEDTFPVEVRPSKVISPEDTQSA